MIGRHAPSITRTIAIVIAIGGVIDPAVTLLRRTRPEVAVVAANAATDRALAARVTDELKDAFTVIQGPFSGAAGTVLVGNRLSGGTSELASPVFAVTPARDAGTVTIERVDAPVRAALDERAMIRVATRTTGAGGRRLTVSLHHGGLVVDRVAVDIANDDARQVTALELVPTAVGAIPLRITTSVDGSAQTAEADVGVDVRERRWAVLFHDQRPSWQSTFVRRAIERDPRFLVTSRVVTSRGLSTDAGRPPARLDDPDALSVFDAVVIGAPEALGERDVAGLDAFMRRRGGTVVLLLDQRGTGAYQRLTGVREWLGATSSAGFLVRGSRGGADSVGLRASEIAWPRSLPPGAHALAGSRGPGGDSGTTHPLIWRSAAGAGQLVVSGALDSWRYRDPAVSAFDTFWRATIAAAADAAPPPVAISLASTTTAPDERVPITVTLRDASLARVPSDGAVRAMVAAALETPAGAVPIRLWPDGPIGTFSGSVRAPSEPGIYRVAVSSADARADAPLIVATATKHARADDSDLVAAWTTLRGGAALTADRLDELAPSLERALRPVTRRETWYPMRSPWWILPFAIALGAEWLWRRRRGLA